MKKPSKQSGIRGLNVSLLLKTVTEYLKTIKGNSISTTKILCLSSLEQKDEESAT